MVGELITLPLRVTGLAVRFYWRATEQALSLASNAAAQVIERVSPAPHQRSSGSETVEATPVPHRPEPAPAPASPRWQSQPTEPVPSPPPSIAPRTKEPIHVSEEPELVDALAEPGAEDGAGAEVHIQEPWDGYRRMNAREVTARLSGASAAELAAVQLFESSTQGRQTVLAAVARRMRVANGSGSQSQGGH
jgi:hypothetical protein